MEFVIDKNGVLKKVKKVRFRDKVIEVPSEVKEIGDAAFFALRRIKEIIIPPSVETIGEYAFQECTNLEQINLPSSIRHIKRSAFYECKSLKSLIIPPSVEKIDEYCFSNCVNLENLEILGPIEVLNPYTFDNCFKLKNLSLPKTLKTIRDFAFTDVNKMEKLIIKNRETLKEIELWHFFEEQENFYVNENDEILISNENQTIYGFKKIDYQKYKEIMQCSNQTAVYTALFLDFNIIKKHEFLKIVLSKIINYSNDSSEIESIKNKINDYKEFENLTRRLMKKNINIRKEKDKNFYAFYKVAKTLGAFSSNQRERQKACEFLFYAIDREYFKFSKINDIFQNLNNSEFNKEWAEFLMNKENFEKLLKLEKKEKGKMAKIYNNFYQIKEFGRSNRGNQHYRKVTVDMCIECLTKVKFDNVNKETADIAEELSKYTRKQSSFDIAADVRNQYLKMKEQNLIEDHILGEELKEIREEMAENIKETIDNLNDIANSKFTYEFLSKYDPVNFVLGKYCSCCSHIEGIGDGIVIASVLHPDCQNLIIRDNKGSIIAKSTMYVNRKQGYCLFNNVEINDRFMDKSSKNLIYKKYMEAIENFVFKYNQKNKENTIRQVNVGMNLNDLEVELLKQKHKISKELLRGINFSFYGGHDGDWQNNQVILWKSENLKKGAIKHGG